MERVVVEREKVLTDYSILSVVRGLNTSIFEGV